MRKISFLLVFLTFLSIEIFARDYNSIDQLVHSGFWEEAENGSSGLIVEKTGSGVTVRRDRTIGLRSNLSCAGEEGVVFQCFEGLAFTTANDGYSSDTVASSVDAGFTDTTIVLSNTAGLQVDGYIKIFDNFLVDGFRNGEMVQVTAINGTNVTIKRPLYD